MIISYIIFPLLFFIVSVYLAKKDFLLVVAFILLLNTILNILLFKLIPNVAFASGTFINITIILIFLYYFTKNTKQIIQHKYFLIYFGSIFSLLFYLYLLALYRGNEPIEYFNFVRNFFFNFLLLIIFFSVKQKRRIEVKFYFKIIFLITLFEVFLGLIQFSYQPIADFFRITEYTRFGEVIERLDVVFRNQKIVTGTLLSMANFSYFVTNMILFIFALTIDKIIINSKLNYVILLLGVLAVMLTGIKAPIISLFVGISLVLWFSNKRYAIVFFSVSALVIILYIGVLEPIISSSISAKGGAGLVENPLERLVGIFAISDTYFLEKTTFGRTMVLAQYLFDNFIFGKGLGLIFTNYSYTDAFLTILFLEFGAIGFLIIIFPYLFTLRKLKLTVEPKIYKIGLMLFVVVITQSIVDEGLWSWFTNIQFFFLIMVLFRINENRKEKIESINNFR